MNIAAMIAGPAVGAVIGYVTNWIAVKMLFLPRKELRLFGRRVPFTPGIIPKRRDALAASIGKIIETKLLPKEAVRALFLTGDFKNQAVMAITNALTDDGATLGERLTGLPAGAAMREKAEAILAHRLGEALAEYDFQPLIQQQGKEIIKEKLGGLAAMFVTDELMAGLAKTAQDKISAYARENSEALLPAVHEEINRLLALTPDEAMTRLGFSSLELFPLVCALYDQFADRLAEGLTGSLRLGQEVEKRMAQMSVKELEDLVLAAMKNELTAIVRLGGLVGLVLGLINLWFSL